MLDIEISKEIKKAFEVFLQTESARIRSGGREITIRCPYCGDSNNIKSSHLYISTSSPFLYDCKLCPRVGFVGKNFIRRVFGEPKISLENVFKKYTNKSKFIKTISNMEEEEIDLKFENLKYPFDELKYANVINYLYKRTKIKLNINNINTYKIILNIRDFIILNKLEDLIVSPKKNLTKDMFLKKLNNFIGFPSSSNKGINCRDITGNYSRRYYTLKYKGLEKRRGGIHNFVIGNKIDMMSKYPIIVLAEGPFDILNIYNKFYKNNKNMIFSSVGSKSSYATTLKKIIIETGFVDADVYIFSDDGTNPDYYNHIAKLWQNNISVFFNEEKCDYGDYHKIGNLEKFIIKPS